MSSSGLQGWSECAARPRIRRGGPALVTQQPTHHIDQSPFQAPQRRSCRLPFRSLLRVVRLCQRLTAQLAHRDQVERPIQSSVPAPIEPVPVPTARRDRHGRDPRQRRQRRSGADARCATEFTDQPCRRDYPDAAQIEQRRSRRSDARGEGSFDCFDLFPQAQQLLGQLMHDQQARLDDAVGVRQIKRVASSGCPSGSSACRSARRSRDRSAASAHGVD